MGLRQGVVELQAARRERQAAAPLMPAVPKVWLHPRLSEPQAQAIADRLGCRMTWKGRGVALVPLGHA